VVSDVDAQVDEQSVCITYCSSVEIGLNGSKNELVGFGYEAAGLKVGLVGVEVALFDMLFEFNGVAFKTKTYQKHKHAIHVKGL
jgi:hypothetical protein